MSSLILELRYKELGDDNHISWLNDCKCMLNSSLWMEPMETLLWVKEPFNGVPLPNIVWLSLTCLLHLLTLLFVNSEADYTKGIFQAIGFKEFHQYLLLHEEDRNSEKGSRFFHAGVDALKLVTKRYARRQLRWINNRFLRKTSRQVGVVLDKLCSIHRSTVHTVYFVILIIPCWKWQYINCSLVKVNYRIFIFFL